MAPARTLAALADNGEDGPMADLVDRIMALWRQLPEDDAAARSAFAELYAERVVVNGAELGLDDLVARARALQGALSDLRHDLLERVEAGDKLVIAFRMFGRHTGLLHTPVGQLSATGREVTIQGMDVLTFTNGRITEITVLADELGLIAQVAPDRLT
jgi:predicted ester cyclase